MNNITVQKMTALLSLHFTSGGFRQQPHHPVKAEVELEIIFHIGKKKSNNSVKKNFLLPKF